MARLFSFKPSFPKATLSLCGLLALQSCTLPTFMNSHTATTAGLPAASYYRWLTLADAEALEQEGLRLAALESEESLVVQIQRFMLLYQADRGRDSFPPIEPDAEQLAACTSNTHCSDYLAFEPLLRELIVSERQLSNSVEAARVLEDRIRNLDQQIEALTNIEQQLLRRDQRPNQ